MPPAARTPGRKEGIHVHGLMPRGYNIPASVRPLFQPAIGHCRQIAEADIITAVNIGAAAIGAGVAAGQAPVIGQIRKSHHIRPIQPGDIPRKTLLPRQPRIIL